ncbi:MAG: O-antigen ligase family protein [Lewinellaceae bacterium]|nr:O-antigen ligase family protein [Lewinellaceae bacterium]
MQVDAVPNWLFRLYQLLFLLLPWSVEADFGAWKLTVPAEPLIAMAGIGLAVALVRHRNLPKPNTLVWLAGSWVGWQVLASLFSSMPVVSWKYVLVDAGQWWVFFAGLLCFPAMWPWLLRLFSWSMVGVVAYTISHHAFFHFRADQALLSPMPFFSDHTVYSAVLVMVLCCLGLQPFNNSRFYRTGMLIQLQAGVYLIALILAASRAAWLSLILAGCFGMALYFRKYWRWGVSVGVLALCTGLFFQKKIQPDVSTQERLNRYACALRMAADRPVTGFGPGTFQFQYLPYQHPEEMTRISLQVPVQKRGPDNYGRGGGAHSEYLQALAETGWPGLVLWLSLVIFSLWRGVRLFMQTRQTTWLLPSLALLSFFLHALANNFLHDARVAALMWGCLALLAGYEQESQNVKGKM